MSQPGDERISFDKQAGGSPSGLPEPPAYGAHGQSLPAYGDPGYGPPAYGQPGYGQPGYGQPGHGQPSYSAPAYGTPGYAPAGYGAPGYGPPGYGAPGFAPPGGPPPFPKPSSNIGWAIASIFLFWPLCIPAFIFASRVDNAWFAGDYWGAKSASDSARRYGIIGVSIGGGIWLLYLLFFVFIFALAV